MRRLALLALCIAGCSREPQAVAAAIESHALPARSAADGPRFVRRHAATTGLSFRNELRRENVIAYVYSGAGLAVGDYDQDGLPDVYLVSQDGPNQLFRQVRPFVFEDVTQAAGGLDGGSSWGKAAVFADIDGDADLDLYVCNTESPNLLYQNQGDGTFVERGGAFGVAVTAASTGAAFADYDNDGDLDLFVLTNRVFGPNLPPELVAEVTLPAAIQKSRDQLFPPVPDFAMRDGQTTVPEGYEGFYFTMQGRVFAGGQADRLLRNDGYMRFVDVTKEAGIGDSGNGLSAVWFDHDDDGLIDLFVANDVHSPDRLWRNRGDGAFVDVAPTALPHLAFFGMGCDFGDLDNDGLLDLAVADMSSTTHYMGKMLMGSMQNHRWFLMNAEPPQQMRNALFRNAGQGMFWELAQQASLASTDWTWSLRFADLDEDGLLDCHATNGISVFEDNPDTIAAYKRLVQLGQKEQALELARRMERVDERNICRRNLGGFRFEDVGAAWGLDELGVSHGAVFVDLDRDGDLDLVTNNLNEEASVYENRTADSRRILVALRGPAKNPYGVGARITVEAGGSTQTRVVSPTRGYMSGNEPIEHFGLGAASRIDRLTVRWPGGQEQSFADLAADCLHTVRFQEQAKAPAPAKGPMPWFAVAPSPLRHQERAFDDYAVQPLLPHRLSTLGPGICVGDVDGDQRDDVFLGGGKGQAGQLWRQRPDGSLGLVAGPWVEDQDCEDLGAVFFDCDQDGDQDLVVASGGVEADGPAQRRCRLYCNDGKGRFVRAAESALPDLQRSFGPVAAADFDRDGDLDLFLGARVLPGRFPRSEGSVLLENLGGRFVDATARVAPGLRTAGMVSGACWADVDGDLWPDLVLACEWGTVSVFVHEEQGLVDRTEALGLSGHSGQWNSVLAEDLDGDGDVDLVAGNLGLNTKYKASAQRPLRLFARDFDGDGTFDVVETKHEAGRLLPVRGLSCSSEAIPQLKAAFATYDQFARATLGEIYGDAQLEQAQSWSCTEMRSAVFEQQDGRFVLRPLPYLAQAAPVYGIAVGDWDGDGTLDLLLAQNSFAPEPETGRFDGGLGLLLRGQQGLAFSAVGALESGIRVRGDQQGLAAMSRGDGSPQPILLSRNDDTVLQCSPQRLAAGLEVRLSGPPGNPTGVGARVGLRVGASLVAARRIGAGGGYLQQGSASVRFAVVPDGALVEVQWPDGAVSSAPARAGGLQTIAR